MKNIVFIFLLFCLVNACNIESKKSADGTLKKQSVTKKKRNKTTPNSEINETSESQRPDQENLRTNSDKINNIEKAECLNVNTGDKSLLKSQTFPFDFDPFEGSCFVTAHDSEFNDPPIGSEISLYKDGKEIYKFESRFNPDSATCYVEAVAFEDLNGDNLQDIIVVGKCGAKSGELVANEVFMNTGEGTFYTNARSNDKLEAYTKIKDVSDFVKKNEDIFFE